MDSPRTPQPPRCISRTNSCIRCIGSSLHGQLHPKEWELLWESAASFSQSGCCREECFVNVFCAVRQLHLLLVASEQPYGVWSRLRCPTLTRKPVHTQLCLPCFCSDIFIAFTSQDRAGTKREDQNMPLQLFPTFPRYNRTEPTSDAFSPLMRCWGRENGFLPN